MRSKQALTLVLTLDKAYPQLLTLGLLGFPGNRRLNSIEIQYILPNPARIYDFFAHYTLYSLEQRPYSLALFLGVNKKLQ